jgi:hypothetical protein
MQWRTSCHPVSLLSLDIQETFVSKSSKIYKADMKTHLKACQDESKTFSSSSWQIGDRHGLLCHGCVKAFKSETQESMLHTYTLYVIYYMYTYMYVVTTYT